jgi:hypothetical protein
MHMAQLYCAQSPFDRLSHPRWHVEANQYYEDGGGGSEIATKKKRTKKKKSKKATFDDFLQRQSERASLKEERIERLRAFVHETKSGGGGEAAVTAVGGGNDDGSDATMALVERKASSPSQVAAGPSFLQRLELYERQKEEQLALTTVAVDDECTFSPAINAVSQRLPGRPVSQLSGGDAARLLHKRELARAAHFRAQLSEVTFQPSLSAQPRADKHHAQTGRLKVTTQGDSYVRRVAAVAAEKELARQQTLQRRAAEEARTCTFQPRVRDSPAFVKRIAHSMALVRRRQQLEVEASGGATPPRPAMTFSTEKV